MGFLVKGVKSVVKAVVGVAAKIGGAVLSVFGLKKKKSPTATSVSRLNKTLNPEAFRKIAFGKTASALDVRYWEVYGTDGTLYDEDIAMASHKINAVKELYLEDELAINASNVVQSKFLGVLSRVYKLGGAGQTALSVGAGGQWTSEAKFDGVAHMVLKWVQDDNKLPNGPPSRYTNIIEGALVYDPRRDGTVAGGSGSHRIDDQDTWEYSPLDSNGVPIGRNNALQSLWYLLGWKIAEKDAGGVLTGEMALVAGRGVEIDDINLQTFITGANNCEAAGYYTDMLLSTEDEHTSNEDKITANGLIGQIIDPGGLWSYYANVDDTANIAVELTDDDVLDISKVEWDEYKGMSQQFGQVVGKFVDPSATALYQPRAYPMVRDATYEANLGVKRRATEDFEQVQDALLAQKLARLKLNQAQFQGEFKAAFHYRALNAQAWSIVRYTSERFGWVKLFRVTKQSIDMGKGVQMVLEETHSSIWTAGSVVSPAPVSAGQKYNSLQEISIVGLTTELASMVSGNGDLGDGFRIYFNTPPSNVKRTEIRYRIVGTTFWETTAPLNKDQTSVVIGPLFSGSLYETQARHISIHEIPGPWLSPAGGSFTLGSTSNVNSAAIAAALTLAQSKGKLFIQTSAPTLDESSAGDTWLNPSNGIFFDRVGENTILNTSTIILNGFIVSLIWTKAIGQPLEATIAVANNASSVANAANARVQAYDDDGILDISEKIKFGLDDEQFEKAYQNIIASASSLSVSSTALTSARLAYTNYRNAITPAWNDITQDSPIVRSSLDTVSIDYSDSIEALRAAIEAKIKVLADTAQAAAVVADGKAEFAEDVAQGASDNVVAGLNLDGSVKPNKVLTASLLANAVTDIAIVDVASTDHTPATAPLVVGSYTIAKPSGTTFIRLTASGTLQLFDNISGPHTVKARFQLRGDGFVVREADLDVSVAAGFPVKRWHDFTMVYVFDAADLANGDVADLYLQSLSGSGSAPRASFRLSQIITEYIKR